MKIALGCNEYPPAPAGGIGTWTQAFARALAAQGDQVWVVGVCPVDRQQIASDQGVQVIRLPASRLFSHRLRHLQDRWTLRVALQQLYRQHQIELVEIPDYQGYGAFYDGACPLVVRLHSLPKRWGDPAYAAARRDSWYERAALGKADAIIAVTQWSKDIARQKYPALPQVTVIYYTLADVFLSEPAQPPARDDALVVFAGTLADHKGVWELARAWPRVKRRFPQARLVYIGKDWDGNRARLAAALPDLDVTFIPHRTQAELAHWYRQATVACFPSRNETFGLVAAEAMACGAAVVYTARGPGPEIGGNGSRALLIDPDNPDSIADAIETILADPLAQRDRVAQAQQWARETLAPSVILPASRAFYQQLIAASSVPGRPRRVERDQST